MMENTTMIYEPALTVNGSELRKMTIDIDEWLIRSKQVGRRHPLDPLGMCMVCGDHKIGYWRFDHWEPE